MARKPIVSLHSIDDFKEIIDEFKKESDRATVILSAAKLDAQLYLLLSKALMPSASSQDELLDGDNPIGTFSSRINLSFRLGLINSQFAKSLHLIRRIRNAFAHEFKSMSLTNGGHADRIRELTVHFKDYANYQEMKESYFKEDITLNADFKMIVAIAILRLDTAIHYCETISSVGVSILPPNWGRKVLTNEQKLKNRKQTGTKKTVKKTAANRVTQGSFTPTSSQNRT